MNRQMRRAAAAGHPAQDPMAAAMAAQNGNQVVQVVQHVAAPIGDAQVSFLLAGMVLAGGHVTDPEEAVAVAHKTMIHARLKIGELMTAMQQIVKAEQEAAEQEAKRKAAEARPKSDVILLPEG
jgi:hypothetical protein